MMDHRSRELYELGRRDLEGRFDPDIGLVRAPFQPQKHMPSPSVYYALCLLLQGERGRAEEMISTVLSMQERRQDDPHYGNFRWFYEDEVVTDLNAVQFVLEAFVRLLLRARDRLSPEMPDWILQAMRLAHAETERLDVHWTYTNIYLLDVANSILGGELLGDDRIQERGRQRLREWADRTKAVGAPHEFNSATYSAVQIHALAAIAQHSRDANTKGLALEMEQFIWRHVARYFHPPTVQLGGPHSRAYRRDVVGASGFLKVLLYKLLGQPRLLAPTPYYSGPDREGEVHAALTEYHCPPDAERLFREAETREIHEVACLKPRTECTAYVAPEFSLGTMSRPYQVGDPPGPWPQHNACILYYRKPHAPGYGVLYCRYLMNGGTYGTVAPESRPMWLDLWEHGIFRTAQKAGKAIVAYGLMPRGQRPVESLRLDVRLLGPNGDGGVLIDGEPYPGGGARDLGPGDPVVIADGEVYIGLIPLEPTGLGHEPAVYIWRDGQELVLSICNYRGPPKSFWEYRSLSGPFFKGNVKNGFVLWVAPRREYRSSAEFSAALRRTPLEDKTIGTVRRIRFGGGRERVALDYDLRRMWP